jgi:S-adenosylmethionine decarboxylase
MTLATHLLIDLEGCDPTRLTDAPGLRSVLLAAIAEAGGTYVTDTFHTFSPHGVSGVIVIAESHVALHTWPEHSYAALDVFSCSAAFRSAYVGDQLAAWLGATARQDVARARGRHFGA